MTDKAQEALDKGLRDANEVVKHFSTLTLNRHLTTAEINDRLSAITTLADAIIADVRDYAEHRPITWMRLA